MVARCQEKHSLVFKCQSEWRLYRPHKGIVASSQVGLGTVAGEGGGGGGGEVEEIDTLLLVKQSY